MSLITYKGISQNSSIERKLTDEEFKNIAIEFYKNQILKKFCNNLFLSILEVVKWIKYINIILSK